MSTSSSSSSSSSSGRSIRSPAASPTPAEYAAADRTAYPNVPLSKEVSPDHPRRKARGGHLGEEPSIGKAPASATPRGSAGAAHSHRGVGFSPVPAALRRAYASPFGDRVPLRDAGGSSNLSGFVAPPPRRDNERRSVRDADTLSFSFIPSDLNLPYGEGRSACEERSLSGGRSHSRETGSLTTPAIRFFEPAEEVPERRVHPEWSSQLGPSWVCQHKNAAFHRQMVTTFPSPRNSWLILPRWDPDCDTILRIICPDPARAREIKAADSPLREVQHRLILTMGPWESLRETLYDLDPEGVNTGLFSPALHATAALTGAAYNTVLVQRRSALLAPLSYKAGSQERKKQFIARVTAGPLKSPSGAPQDPSLLAGPALLALVEGELRSWSQETECHERYSKLALPKATASGRPWSSGFAAKTGPSGSSKRKRQFSSKKQKGNPPKKPRGSKPPFRGGKGGHGASHPKKYVYAVCNVLSGGVGGDNQGQVDPVPDIRGGSNVLQPCLYPPRSDCAIQPHSVEPRAELLGPGRRPSGSRSHTPGHTIPGSIPISRLSDSQKVRVRFPFHSKPKETKFLLRTSKIQNGEPLDGSRSTVPTLLAGQDRPQKCFLQPRHEKEGQSVPQIHMGGRNLRISSHAKRIQPGTPSLYQSAKAGGCPPEITRHHASPLPRRHPDNLSHPRRGEISPLPGENPPHPSGIYSKSREIVTGTISDDRVPRVHPGYLLDEHLPARRKESKHLGTLPRTAKPGDLLSQRLSKNTGPTTGSRPSHQDSETPLSKTARSEDRSTEEGEKLRSSYSSFPSGEGRAILVDRAPSKNGRNPHPPRRKPTYRDLYRRLARRVRSFLRRRRDSSTLDRRQKRSAHKHPRDARSPHSPGTFHQKYTRVLHTHEDRQQNCPILHKQDGGHKIASPDRLSSPILGTSAEQKTHSPSRIHQIGGQRCSRPAVTTSNPEERMVSSPTSVQGHNTKVGTTNGGPICEPPQCQSPDLHLMEVSGPSMGNGCIENTVALNSPRLRLPGIQPDRENPEEAGIIESRSTNHDLPSLEDSFLVSPTSVETSGDPHVPTGLGGSDHRPVGRTTPPPRAGHPELEGLDGFTKRARAEGFSIRAAEYLRLRWRTGSRKTYEAYWRSWAKWCNSRQIDPFEAPIPKIAEYLIQLFESGTATSSLGVARSAISAFASHRRGAPIGQSRRIIELMRAFKNLRPARARYSVTWSIDKILEYWNRQPENSLLSLKLLTIKAATLISISALTRADELGNMLLENYAERDSGIAFRLQKAPKNHHDGPVPDILLEYNPDAPNICPAVCTLEYIRHTSPFREYEDNIDRSLLFVSLDKRHANVKPGTISSWIKQGMNLAGIDTSTFKAHSIRGASVSNALARGITLKEIMKKGRWKSDSVLKRFYVRDLA